MATNIELYNAWFNQIDPDSELFKQLGWGVINAAITIMNEDDKTANHAKRLELARRIYWGTQRDVESFVYRLYKQVAKDNLALLLGSPTDEQINTFVVNNVSLLISPVFGKPLAEGISK